MRERTTWLELLDYFTLAPVRETLLDLSALTPDQRRLAQGGYAMLLLIGLSTALWTVLREVLPKVTYLAPGEFTRELSILSIIVCGLGFAVGWSYLLVGAVQQRLPFFLGVFGLFALNGLWMRASSVSELMPTRLLAVLPLLLVVGGFLWWGKSRLTSSIPRFILALAALILLWMLLFWFSGDPANRALHWQVIFGLIFLAALPLWVLAGAAIINFSISFARHVTLRLRTQLQPDSFRRLTLFALCLHPALACGFGLPFFALFVTNDRAIQGIANWFATDFVATLPLALWALVSLARKRWSTRTAGLLLALRLTVFLFVIVLQILILGDLNVAELGTTAVERLGVIPPEIFFMATLLLSVLGFFIPLAREESPRFPQTLRLYLTFGASILVVSMMFFFFSARDVETGENLASGVLLPGLLTLGLYYGGFLYILFLVWSQKEEFIGDLEAWDQEVDSALPTPSLSYRGLSLLVLLLPMWAGLFSCCLLLLIAPFRSPAGP